MRAKPGTRCLLRVFLLVRRESLKQFVSHFAETTDILGNFNLDVLESQDRQLKFQGVRFEAS